MNVTKLASANGFPTKYWGKSGWRLIHLAALNFPLEPVSEETRQGYYDFFNSLCFILPCGVCRAEFCKMVKNQKSPLALNKERFAPRKGHALPWQTRFDLFKWTVDLHNAVNQRLRNKTRLHDVNHWLNYYLKMRSHGSEKPKKAGQRRGLGRLWVSGLATPKRRST